MGKFGRDWRRGLGKESRWKSSYESSRMCELTTGESRLVVGESGVVGEESILDIGCNVKLGMEIRENNNN